MTIKYKNFTLTPGNGITSWDVHKTIKVVANTKMIADKLGVKIGGTTGKTREVLVGYDFRMESAIRAIIETIVANKDEHASLSDFLVAYTKEKQDVIRAINGVMTPVL